MERQNDVTAPEPASPEPPDGGLIVAWRSGDEAAATELVRRHTHAVARFLAAAGAREDLDDLVQETFVRAFRRITGFRGTASFRTWLFAIASNALKDVHRSRGRRQIISLEERDLPDARHDPHASAEESDMLGRMEQAVQRLTPMQRDVFLMRAQDGAEYGDIAESLGTTVGAARVHYHHAVKRLKEELK